MREIRQSGSEGGARLIPRSYPYPFGRDQFSAFKRETASSGIGRSHSTEPILRARTNRTSPSRVFLSSFMASQRALFWASVTH